MENVLSIIGTMTAIVSAAIALTAFTAESRLHRRIEKLASAATLMGRSPSPVIQRALRYSLAELQSREALREQQRGQRLFTLALPPIVILLAALFATSLLAYPLPMPIVADYETSLALGLLWVGISLLASLLLAKSCLLEFKRRDFRNAYFLGEELTEDEISLLSLHQIRARDVRRSLVAGAFVNASCQFVGLSLALLTTAALAPEYSSFFIAFSALFGATAAGLYIYGQAPRVRAQDSTVWPWPKPSDFRAQDW